MYKQLAVLGFVGFALSSLATSATAGNFEGYIQMRKSNDPVVKASLMVYHNGIVETLWAFSKTEKKDDPAAVICPPAGKAFNEDFVASYAMNLWQEAVSKKTEGSMKGMPVGAIVTMSLLRKYPCK
ncbi:MAG: hypothetical protein OEL20_17440 [Sulfuritalea sp.]|jgi:hypothetical protein|nr:hypothetical protein [Sulfuritalea sp.]